MLDHNFPINNFRILTRTLEAALFLTFFLLQGCNSTAETVMQNMSSFDSQLSIDLEGRGPVRATFFGTSTLLFDDGTTRILVDAFLSRPGFRTLALHRIESNPIEIKRIFDKTDTDKIDAVIISHNHYDHALDAAYVANLTGAKLVGTESTMNIGLGGDVDCKKLVQMNPVKIETFGDFSVQMIPTVHSRPIPLINDDQGEEITSPLKMPAKWYEFKEGGSFDVLLSHKSRRILIKTSANYLSGALAGIEADVVFLAVGGIGNETDTFLESFYKQTIRATSPSLVIPIHWDNFFYPLSENLKYLSSKDITIGLTNIVKRANTDQIPVVLVQGLSTISLFN
jgi:L-ascorbate metabolism protein UlaG (beta-lactamase superfamily)